MPSLALTLEVEAASAEALSDALVEAGAQSVLLEDVEAPRCRLRALMAPGGDAAALVAAAAAAAGLTAAPRFSAEALADEDWVRRSQAQFPALSVGARLWIGPSWTGPPPGRAAVVRLDPGLAFGTGSHPSTRLVLAFLERHVRGGERVLDYGCGSGILAIAAAKLGAVLVDAVDSDPEAVRTAAANASENAVALRIGAPDELAPGSYDLVVSNILAQPLILLAPLLAARAAPRSRIALSGILAGQGTEVMTAYAGYFDMAATAEEDGWVLLEGSRR